MASVSLRKNYIMSKKLEPVSKIQFSVTERFKFISQFVDLLATKKINSFILTGSGGLGKTHSVLEGLKAKGLKEDTIAQDGDFIFIRGYSTAKALYRTLWEQNGKVIIFDDADSVHKDPIGANILKAALGSEDKRVISWGAEFPESESLPNRFEFRGRIVFISNLSQQQFPQALLSRSMRVDLTLNTAEKIERINDVFNTIDGEVDEKEEVLSFIEQYAEVASDLNIRSALNILKLKRDVGKDWERLALYNFVS
jgi:replication-associated recombination protein RarA